MKIFKPKIISSILLITILFTFVISSFASYSNAICTYKVGTGSQAFVCCTGSYGPYWASPTQYPPSPCTQSSKCEIGTQYCMNSTGNCDAEMKIVPKPSGYMGSVYNTCSFS